MPETARLEFASKFFLLSLVVLSFTSLASQVVKRLSLNNVWYFKKPQVFLQEPNNPIPQLSLLGPQAVKNNTSFEVLLTLNTDNQDIQAVDVILSYNPNLLELSQFTPSNIFFESSNLKKDNNYLKFSFLATDQKNFSGSGQLASLKFLAKNKGKANLDFLAKPGATADSNLILKNESKDSLLNSQGLEISIL